MMFTSFVIKPLSLQGAPPPGSGEGAFSFRAPEWFDAAFHYFLVASGAAGAGAGVASGAGGAGASAGFGSSLTAGFSGSFWPHPVAMRAKFTTITNASKSKIHFFMCLHLLSD
jgi:hypothetical protein